MDNVYVRKLRVSKRLVGKKLYAAVALLLVASLLVSTATYAWLTLSLAPEATDITTTIGANGNLEIALATTDHLASLEANNMYDDDSNFEYTTGDPVHDNVLWGNLIDLTAVDYGLHVLNMRPAVLNVIDGTVADMPISVGAYGADGRLTSLNFSSDNIDLKTIGFAGIYDKDVADYIAGSVSMSVDDLKSGNYNKQELVDSVLEDTEYGVRIAGPLEYSASLDQGGNDTNINLLVDGYCFGIDLLFRTNAPTGNLMLQTEGVQRMESELEDEYVGSGSFITISNEKLSAAMKVVFANTLTGEVYALAQADSNGKLWITARADENGTLVPTANDDAAMIKPLVQNQVSAVTAWVYIDGSLVDNSAATTKDAMELLVNLQFSTDAVLNPAYTDKNTNPNYPNRPEMPYNPSGPTEPIEVGPVSNLRFEVVDGKIALVYDYPEGITESFNSVLYDVIISNSTTGKSFTRQNITNTIVLTEYSNLTAGTYDKFHVDSELNYEVVASVDFDNLELVVNESDSTSERLYVRIDPTSEMSNYAFTYIISGLTPNTPFLLYTASESVALGTAGGPSYSAVTVGMSDANGNVTASLGAWSSITALKENPNEYGSELTKLYFKIIECTDSYVSADGLDASFTRNLRCDWTHYVPGGVGTNANQNGTLSDNISWLYTTDGTLRISGTGAMTVCESGEYPWSGLSGIVTKVIIEDGVTTVADWAFEEFIRLQSVSFGSSITEIGDYAFYQCHDLQNFILPDGLLTIGDCAFRDCESITVVNMPDSVTELGHWAFVGCSGLESVKLSNSLTEITAFGWCSSLKSIVIPEGVTTIGSQAFNVCTSLETITLPTTLTSISSYAFDACDSLTDVYYNGSRSMWKRINISKTYNEDLLNANIHYAIEETLSDSVYYFDPEGTNKYTLFAMKNGERDYEMTFSGVLDSSTQSITINTVSNYPTNGVIIPAVVVDPASGTEYSVLINSTRSPFANLGVANASISFVGIDGQKVIPSSTILSNLFKHNTGTEFVSIDLSGLDTSTVTNMSNLVYGCDKLTYLNLEGIDTSNVTNMSYMFAYCSSLTSLDVSNFDTANVTDMNNMFYNCRNVATLNVSGFNTSKVTDMNRMFDNCSSVTELDVSNFDTANVTLMDCMFVNCSGLTELDLTSFNTAKVTNMFYMLSGLEGLTELDLSSFNTTNVTNLAYLFSGSSNLKKLDLSHFNTTNATSMAGMFYGCTGLVELDISNFDTAKVTNMWALFRDCESLTNVDISNFNTANVEDMCYMFYRCFALTELDLSHFNTARVSSMRYMFYGCRGLTELNISNFDTANVTEMDRMFEGCQALTTIDVSSFNTAKVANMREMFQNCVLITELNLSNFNIANVTDMTSMFSGCTKLTILDLSGWDLSTVSETSGMFYNCPAGNTYIN